MPVMIQFHDPAGFLDELRRFHLGSRVVRVAAFEPESSVDVQQQYQLVAGFLDDSGQLVELSFTLGAFIADYDRSRAMAAQLEHRRRRLIEEIEQLGHQVRFGRFLLEQRS